jgi:hypothetical protein
MGERHWTFWRLLSHTLILPWAIFFLTMLAYPDLLTPAPGRNQNREGFAFLGFVALIWVFGLANLWEIRQRKKAGIEWHTYYRGKLRFLPNNSFVKCLVIPIGSGAIGYGFFQLFPPLGIYIFLMAAVQFLEAIDGCRDAKIEKLDRRDREIEMEIKTLKLEGRRGPLEMVRFGKPSRRVRTPDEEALFAKRWSKVLNSTDSQKKRIAH